jgi:hypothetical protein
MPKSGSMANNHAKIAAAAIVDLLNGRTPEPVKIINTCYSFVLPKEGIRVSSVHEWDASQGTLVGGKRLGRRLRREKRGRGKLRVELGPYHMG